MKGSCSPSGVQHPGGGGVLYDYNDIHRNVQWRIPYNNTFKQVPWVSGDPNDNCTYPGCRMAVMCNKNFPSTMQCALVDYDNGGARDLLFFGGKEAFRTSTTSANGRILRSFMSGSVKSPLRSRLRMARLT